MVRVVQGLVDPDFITESSVVLSQDLIEATSLGCRYGSRDDRL